MSIPGQRTLTKAALVDTVYEKVRSFSKKETVDVVDVVLDLIKDALVGGENVKISRFGCFEVRDKKAREGRNPVTGEALTIDARRVLKFRVSPVLKDGMSR